MLFRSVSIAWLVSSSLHTRSANVDGWSFIRRGFHFVKQRLDQHWGSHSVSCLVGNGVLSLESKLPINIIRNDEIDGVLHVV